MTRCFLGITLSNEIKQCLINSQNNLKNQQIFNGRWEKETNMHVTLRFLGELDDNQLHLLQNKLNNISFPSFLINIGPLGYFSGGKNNPFRVIWAKVKGCEYLQEQIDNILLPEFPPDKKGLKEMKTKKYTHHITLCRVKNNTKSVNICKEILNNEQLQQDITIKSFYLIKSTLSKQGSTYSIIKEYNSTE